MMSTRFTFSELCTEGAFPTGFAIHGGLKTPDAALTTIINKQRLVLRASVEGRPCTLIFLSIAERTAAPVTSHRAAMGALRPPFPL